MDQQPQVNLFSLRSVFVAGLFGIATWPLGASGLEQFLVSVAVLIAVSALEALWKIALWLQVLQMSYASVERARSSQLVDEPESNE